MRVNLLLFSLYTLGAIPCNLSEEAVATVAFEELIELFGTAMVNAGTAHAMPRLLVENRRVPTIGC